MSDERLRELERRASEGGTEDRAAYLRARVHAGLLTREGVHLAAYLGDQVARLVVPPPWGGGELVTTTGRTTSPTWEQWDEWQWDPIRDGLAGLEHWPGAMVRAAVAVGRAALPAWEERWASECAGERVPGLGDGATFCEQVGGPSTRTCPSQCTAPRRALEAVEEWIADPSEANRQRCAELGRVEQGASALPYRVSGILWSIAPRDPINLQHGRWHAAKRAIEHSGLTEPQVRTAIREALVPWALAL